MLTLLNGVFTGAEIAIVALRKSRLKELVDEGHPAAAAVQSLRDNPERFLATVQVCITLISMGTAVYGEARIASDLARIFQLPGVPESWSRGAASFLVVLLVSFASLVLGELVPKSLALRASEPYALVIGQPLKAVAFLFRPLVRILTISSNAVLGVFGDRTSFTEARLSREELETLLDEAAKVGAINTHSAEIAVRALGFAELTASDVMVPRGQVVAVDIKASPERLRAIVLEKKHTRMPVFDGVLDNITGYVALKDLAELALQQKPINLKDVARKVLIVPETMTASDLLLELQAKRRHLAVVVDEAGDVAGIVTMEDLVEELVGEIYSEHDKSAATDSMRVDPDGSIVAQGNVPVRELNREYELDLEESDQWTSIAGLCMARAGRIPEAGARLELENGVVILVLDATPTRVKLVRIVPPPKPPEEPARVEE
ncbi:MAG: hypothetical protein GMKNLPBB_00848 [Myxococcota bacterium]|nr:hypothetical protein [Myxococcota bacterium]